MTRIEKLTQSIGYNFKNIELLSRSLTHSSIGSKHRNYEILEFLGDRVLGLAISTVLFKNSKNHNEGELSKKLSFLVCKETLIKIADKINLEKNLNISKEISNSSLDTIKANSLEAIIAAIYLDSDFSTVEKVIKKLWKTEINDIDLSKYDPKSRLQEWCLKKENRLPIYECISKTGPQHEPIFTMSVEFNKDLKATGIGKNKQEAEIDAARILLKKIENKRK